MEKNELLCLVYPNPTENTVNIKFENPASNPVQLSVFDASGSLVSREKNNIGEAGIVDIRWSATHHNAQPGIYQYVLKSGEFITRGKFVIDHD